MKTEYAVGNIRIHFESRTRRRWFVALVYAVFAVFDVVDVAWSSGKAKDTPGALIMSACLILCVGLVVIFGAITGDMRARGDEREMHRRDHAVFKAYYSLSYWLIGVLIAGYFKGPNPVTPLLPLALRSFLMQLPSMLLIAIGILYITLPQAILLWTEPDMDLN
jgi:hypothetical protein